MEQSSYDHDTHHEEYVAEDEEDEEEEEEGSIERNMTGESSSLCSSSGGGGATTPPVRGELVPEPRPMDVICGRGSRISHPGNQRFRKLVSEQKGAYQRAARREDKTKITLDIVQRLMRCEDPSRFLLKDSKANCWYDVGFEYAKDKVSHALRSRPNEERRKRTKPKKKVMPKPSFSPELQGVVQGMIADQQSLLRSMIESEICG